VRIGLPPREGIVKTQTRNAITVVAAVLALFAVIVAYVLVNPRIPGPVAPEVGIATGQVAPSFTIRDVNGTGWNLSLHRGQVVLLDFMGAHCISCEFEMSSGRLQSMHASYSPRGFTILSIDVGPSYPGLLGARTPDEAWRFMHGLNPDNSTRWPAGQWSVALDSQSLATTFAVKALPMKYLLDGSGKIVWRFSGYGGSSDSDALEAQIRAHLG
jgi:glutathione peroxidase-family protein